MSAFLAAVVLLLVTPGPGVLSAAGVGSGFGYRAGLRYIIGLFLGAALVAGVVVSGLGAVVIADPRVRGVLSVLSAGYLLWLAWRIAFAGARVGFIHRPAPPGLRGGILLQVLNPKAYAVTTAIISGFPLVAGSLGAEIALKMLIFFTIWIPIHLGWLWFGVTVRRLDLEPAVQRAINVAMALAMLGVVALALVA